ncbi:MAG: hypothetical protein MUF37_00490 [Methanoregulaceae archaeon]|jgi:hypothetical protein|nr:hypothetical protein [Methanoregulaceae archaeon]
MKETTYFSTGISSLLIILLFAGVVCADPSVTQAPEIQGLSTTTTVNAIGLMTETDSLSWQLSNLGINNSLAAPGYPPYDAGNGTVLVWDDIYPYTSHTPGQVLYTTAYDANIVAQAGQISFIKTLGVNTGNKALGQSNIDTQTGITFIAADDGGNVVGTENLMLDGAGMYDLTANKMLCPFGSQSSLFIPPFCNIVQTGSKYDLTVGSITTDANNRFVGDDATIPVVQNYAINIKPYGISEGQIPAMGSAMAYMKVHTQEGRLIYAYSFSQEPEANVYKLVKSQDITYSESSSALGVISSFAKSLSYNSGTSLI